MTDGLTVEQDGEIVLALDCGLYSLFGENAGEFIKVFFVHKK